MPDYRTSDPHTWAHAKLLIAGGFGAGKTTMVGSVSQIPPLRTEETITAASAGADSLAGVEQKNTTTVALDYGRICLDQGLVLHLYGTPGQDRFAFMWHRLANGAIGAVVLVDTRPGRLELSYAPVEYFAAWRIPFVIAINRFPDAPLYTEEQIAAHLDLDADTPVISCDARNREHVRAALITLVCHALNATATTAP